MKSSRRDSNNENTVIPSVNDSKIMKSTHSYERQEMILDMPAVSLPDLNGRKKRRKKMQKKQGSKTKSNYEDPIFEGRVIDWDINKLLLKITGTAVATIASLFINNTNGKAMELRLGLSAGFFVMAFVACLIKLKCRKRKRASKLLGKLSYAGTVDGFVLITSLFLPTQMIWIPVVVATISTVILLMT